MEKRNYFQPETKVMSMAVNGAVCDPAETSAPTGPKQDEPLF